MDKKHKIKRTVVIYPGRFQPFGKHHGATFLWIKNNFPYADAYIGTSNKTADNSPFNFNEKKAIISAYGFAPNVKRIDNPYKAEEILRKYDPNTTAVIFVVGKKDADRLSGRSGYFLQYPDQKFYYHPQDLEQKLKPFSENGYVLIAPHIKLKVPGYGEMSGTAIRKVLSNPPKNTQERKKLFTSIFGWYADKLATMIFNKLKNLKEDIIPGGVSDGKRLIDIAKKHKVSLQNITAEFKKGVTIELEHTTNKKIAGEIAIDHLFEDPKYYTKLRSLHLEEASPFSVEWWKNSINESHLVNHSKTELTKAGLFDKDSDYNGLIGDAVLELIKTFANQGHSGFSAGWVTELFGKLSRYETLTPLTEDDWYDVTEQGSPNGTTLYQSTRNPAAFCTDPKDKKTWYHVDGKKLLEYLNSNKHLLTEGGAAGHYANEDTGKVKCALCNEWIGQIQYRHLKYKHNGMTLNEYKEKFPGFPLIAESIKNIGEKNPMNSMESRKKIKDTKLERYGAANYNNSKMTSGEKNGFSKLKRNNPDKFQGILENNRKIWKSKEYRHAVSTGVTQSYINNPELVINKKRTTSEYRNTKSTEYRARMEELGLWTPRDQMTARDRYYNEVNEITAINFRKYYHDIPGALNRNRGNHLDHKLSRHFGYENNIHPQVVGHYMNLEVIPATLNESKGKNNSVNLDNLILDITNSKHPLDSRILLQCGGAAGHMAHIFDLPQVKTGPDLVRAFVDTAKSLQTTPAAVKIDGVNTTLKIVKKNGKTQFALDRGSMNPLDVSGITVNDLGGRFSDGHGMLKLGKAVLDAFNTCLPKITSELNQLGMLKNPNILLNIETVVGDSSGKTNVISYKDNFFVIHGILKSEQATPKRRKQVEIPGKASIINALAEKCKPIMKKLGYGVYGVIPTTPKQKISYTTVLNTPVTVQFNKKDKQTKSLKQWLATAVNPKDQKIKFSDGRTDTAMTRKNYLGITNQKMFIDDLTDDPKAKKILIDGAIIYHATRLMGNEILDKLNSEVGDVSSHEGIVVRDPKIANIPFKITGEFIVSGLQSTFGT